MANLPPLSLYIHIPWCVQKCPYCDFNSHALKGEVPHDDYVQHLLNDLRADAHYAQGREIGTIFIGGGTPSLLSGPAMQTLLDGVRESLPLASNAEITMEANPGTVEADRFVEYQRAGINRISIGVQSFSEQKLQRLGRIHGPQEAKRAANLASGLGLRSFNLDLMHGLPDQSLEEALERQEIRRILLTRPAVEAGEKLGFLPGDLSQKVDPYLRPLYDALFEMLGFEKVEKLIERNVIEVAPLAYMRGRTLNDAFIILDESQNTTIEQMKMFLTRIGFNSKAVITGDITQIDLPRSTKSGLRHAIEVLAEVDEISFNFFHSEDVVRHPVVARIVNAYEAWEAADQKRKAELAAERKREAQEQEQK